MIPFHVALHARPPGNWREELLTIDGRSVMRLILASNQVTAPLPVSFDEAMGAISAFPRMHIESDGALVWVDDTCDAGRWQLDGTLIDRGAQLQYVELKGTSTAAAFAQIAAVFRPPPAALVVQLLRHAVFVTEEEFRRFQFG